MTKFDIPKEFDTTVYFNFHDNLMEMSLDVTRRIDDAEQPLNHIVGKESVDIYLMLYHHIEKKAVEAHYGPPRGPIPEVYLFYDEGVLHVMYADFQDMIAVCALDNPEGTILYSRLIGS